MVSKNVVKCNVTHYTYLDIDVIYPFAIWTNLLPKYRLLNQFMGPY